MSKPQFMSEQELATLARNCREAAGKTQVDAAKDMGTSRHAIYKAELVPNASVTKLRCRMIETYSKMKVTGPFYRLEEK